jgi:hypothetical protein
MDDPNYALLDKTVDFEFYALKTLAAADVQAIVAALKATAETDLATLAGYFGKGVPRGLPFEILIDDEDKGAHHNGCADTQIYVGFNPHIRAQVQGDALMATYQFMMIAEVVEVFEAMTVSWNCGYAPGEGLSRVLAFDCHRDAKFSSTANAWAKAGRPNWVDQMDPSDKHDPSIGCAVLFLNWLHFVRGFSWTDIIATDRRTLAQIYADLTGSNDGWAQFSTDMARRFPDGTAIPSDQPFPTGG